MGIWEFTHYDDEDLNKISDAVDVLAEFGIEQSDEMTDELYAEINKREEEDYTRLGKR